MTCLWSLFTVYFLPSLSNWRKKIDKNTFIWTSFFSVSLYICLCESGYNCGVRYWFCFSFGLALIWLGLRVSLELLMQSFCDTVFETPGSNKIISIILSIRISTPPPPVPFHDIACQLLRHKQNPSYPPHLLQFCIVSSEKSSCILKQMLLKCEGSVVQMIIVGSLLLKAH